MKTMILVTTLLMGTLAQAQVAEAVPTKLKQLFVSAVQKHLDQKYTNEYVGLNDIELKSEVQLVEINKAGTTLVLQADIYGETQDFEFGDSVEELELNCQVKIRKVGQTWVSKKPKCNE